MIDPWAWMDALSAWLLRSAMEAGVMVLVVLFVQAALGRWLTPAARYSLWLLVLLRLFAPIAPDSSFSLFNLMPRPASVAPHSIPDVPIDAPSITQRPQSPSDTVIPPSSAAVPWTRFVVLAWSIGCAALLLYVVVATLRLQRRLADAEPAADPHIDRLLTECQQQIGIGANVRVCLVEGLESPALTGVFRPRLLLPRSMFHQLQPQEVRFVVLHELAHLKREDLIASWIATAVLAIQWFNPLIWLAAWRCRNDREIACDARVLEVTHPSQWRDYGRAIVRFLETMCPASTTFPAAVGMLDQPSLIKRRIRMIARFDSRRSRWNPVFTFATIAALALTTLTRATPPQPADIVAVAADAPTPAAVGPADTPRPPAAESPAPSAPAQDQRLITIHLALEDQDKVEASPVALFKLQDPEKSYLSTTRHSAKLVPGVNKINARLLPDGEYYVYFQAGPHYAWQWHRGNAAAGVFNFEDSGEELKLTLYRKRYVTVRYVLNMLHKRNLTGDETETGVRTLVHATGLPTFDEDWQLWQGGAEGEFYGPVPRFQIGRMYPGYGFASPPPGSSFDKLTVAPPAGRYRLEDVEIKPGSIYFSRVATNEEKNDYYGKVLVESISLDPPPGFRHEKPIE